MIRTSLATLAALAAISCQSTPIANLEKSFTIKVEASTGTGDPVKIDFLWVVDNSASMCEEQFALTDNFDVFVDTLSRLAIDPRVAVTTADAQCPLDNASVHSARGVFNRVPASAFPPSCGWREIAQCSTEGDCDNALGAAGSWTCNSALSAECRVNPNGSVNTTCSFKCSADLGGDAYCQAAAEAKGRENADKYVCNTTGVCILPPQTSGCPADLPAVLEGEQIVGPNSLFGCIATVGVNQEKCFKYEQGMRTALEALDPSGPNAEQARGFLRDDAYLVIIFVTDEEDCSVSDDNAINETNYDTCGVLDDQDSGGPLIPVRDFVNRYKALKRDPSRVIVAAIAGDTLSEPGTPQAETDRTEYVASKSDPKTCFNSTYICSSSNGKADWGRRYRELADGFGAYGVFTNICGSEGFGEALQTIADTIIAAISRICLPHPIHEGTSVHVEKRVAGQAPQPLTENVDYTIGAGGEPCTVDGEERQAVFITGGLELGEEIYVTYQGDPDLGSEP